jgi:cation transport regulator ChaC
MFTASAPGQPRAITAGMFGSGFAFRLARAEAAAVGGTLARREDCLTLELPALTAPTSAHSVDH